MPSDLRVLALDDAHAGLAVDDARVRPLRRVDAEALAVAYLDSFAAGVGPTDLAAARADMAGAVAGEFGVLRPDASFVVDEGGAAGAVIVVEHSIWDDELPGPFVTDLFAAPSLRGSGAGAALMRAAIAACAAAGDATLSLRVGAGTSPAAHRIYERLGFVAVTR